MQPLRPREQARVLAASPGLVPFDRFKGIPRSDANWTFSSSLCFFLCSKSQNSCVFLVFVLEFVVGFVLRIAKQLCYSCAFVCSSLCFFLCWILEFVVGFVLQDNKTVVLFMCIFVL